MLNGCLRQTDDARSAQLLGDAVEGHPSSNYSHDCSLIPRADRITFRQLAQALDGNVALSDDEWRNSQRRDL